MSFLRMILLGAYLAGVVALVLGVAVRFGIIGLGELGTSGALTFSIACFLCSLATREVATILEKPKERAQVRAAGA